MTKQEFEQIRRKGIAKWIAGLKALRVDGLDGFDTWWDKTGVETCAYCHTFMSVGVGCKLCPLTDDPYFIPAWNSLHDLFDYRCAHCFSTSQLDRNDKRNRTKVRRYCMDILRRIRKSQWQSYMSDIPKGGRHD